MCASILLSLETLGVITGLLMSFRLKHGVYVLHDQTNDLSVTHTQSIQRALSAIVNANLTGASLFTEVH